MSDKPILCLDFDGVLHSYASGWKGACNIPDPPVDGAMAFLVRAVDHFSVSIHSSRARYWGGRRAMKRWLRAQLTDYYWSDPQGIDVRSCYITSDYDDYYTLRADLIVRSISFPLFKPPAHVTIDDRAITFTGDWPHIDQLKSFKPWNR